MARRSLLLWVAMLAVGSSILPWPPVQRTTNECAVASERPMRSGTSTRSPSEQAPRETTALQEKLKVAGFYVHPTMSGRAIDRIAVKDLCAILGCKPADFYPPKRYSAYTLNPDPFSDPEKFTLRTKRFSCSFWLLNWESYGRRDLGEFEARAHVYDFSASRD